MNQVIICSLIIVGMVTALLGVMTFAYVLNNPPADNSNFFLILSGMIALGGFGTGWLGILERGLITKRL